MVSRLTGAILRAFLAMVLTILPSVMLPGITADARQMAALVALFVGLLVLFEYNATAPGMIEFRDAPPFNRCRFALLAVLVAALALVVRDQTLPSALSGLVAAVAGLMAHLLDWPGSPVRLAPLMLQPAAQKEQLDLLRAAVGLGWALSLAGVALVALILHLAGWPRRGPAFNMWVNLPTFDPTTGTDVARRLSRDACINLMLGFALPIVLPVAVRFGLGGFEAGALTSAQTLIWTVVAWVYVPALLALRGVAMLRVAAMVRAKRRASALSWDDDFLPA